MTTDVQRKIAHELYERWVSMWNGNLQQADTIIGDGFKVHLTADAMPPPETPCDPRTVKLWVEKIRRGRDMRYQIDVGPLVDGDTLCVYWRVTGSVSGAKFARVGIDILRIDNGRFVECCTMNNNTWRRGSTAVSAIQFAPEI